MKSPVILLIVCLVLGLSCEVERNVDEYSSSEYEMIRSELDLPQEVENYELHLGEHLLEVGAIFPNLNNPSLAEKQLNNNKSTLGRVLFYDKNLSKDFNISCASCHEPSRAFSDDTQFSEGVDGTITTRNSLALGTTLSFKISYNPINTNVGGTQFSWDDSASSLNEQIKTAFSNENEMNINDDEILQRIAAKDYYDVLFQHAYGDNIINADRIAESIEHFVNAISSKATKFDLGLERTPSFSVENDFYNFSKRENLGKLLYNDNCASCHTTKHNFTVKNRGNNGLELDYADKGVGGRLNRPDLFGIFKIPFLRNIEVTAPYMHDGRFATLEEVVDHYSDGIEDHPNLSDELKNEDGSPRNMNFSKEEKASLLAYLRTLTDHEMMEDVKFSDPFTR